MHALWTDVFAEALDQRSLLLLPAARLIVPLMRRVAPEDRSRRAGLFFLVAAHIILVPVAGLLRAQASTPPRSRATRSHWARAGRRVAVHHRAAQAALGAPPHPARRCDHPRGPGGPIGGASSQDFDVTGVVANPAVVGLALQDTLGNIFMGLALQIDHSFAIGGWIQVGDRTVGVKEIRWRYTTLETRKWETLVMPNSVLTKQQVLVLGRRRGQPEQ